MFDAIVMSATTCCPSLTTWPDTSPYWPSVVLVALTRNGPTGTPANWYAPLALVVVRSVPTPVMPETSCTGTPATMALLAFFTVPRTMPTDTSCRSCVTVWSAVTVTAAVVARPLAGSVADSE